MKINFSCSSALNDGNNYIASVKYYYGREDNPEESVYKHFGDTITFDISKHIDKFSTTSRNTL
jgi:hypothetical protein